VTITIEEDGLTAIRVNDSMKSAAIVRALRETDRVGKLRLSSITVTLNPATGGDLRHGTGDMTSAEQKESGRSGDESQESYGLRPQGYGQQSPGGRCRLSPPSSPPPGERPLEHFRRLIGLIVASGMRRRESGRGIAAGPEGIRKRSMMTPSRPISVP